MSFTPAFSILVPGALGLVGVADVLGGDAAAADSLVATLSTMVAIALGVLAGSSLSNRMRRPGALIAGARSAEDGGVPVANDAQGVERRGAVRSKDERSPARGDSKEGSPS